MTILFHYWIAFAKSFVKQHTKTIKSVTPEVTRRLFAYEWPGNIRELRNMVETMVVLDTDELIDTDDLPPELADVPATLTTDAGNPALGTHRKIPGRYRKVGYSGNLTPDQRKPRRDGTYFGNRRRAPCIARSKNMTYRKKSNPQPFL